MVDALGHLFCIEGTATTPVSHRLEAMQHHFWNRSILRNKAVPLSGRLRRYTSTVRATPLYGAGTLRFTRETAQKVIATDHRLVRSVWKPMRLKDESWGRWQERTFKGTKTLLERAGEESMLGLMLRTKHQWAGHVARLPLNNIVSLLSRWRNTEWWIKFQAEWFSADPRNFTRWKHTRPGTHNRWDSAVVEHYGTDWRVLAQDRLAWKGLEDAWTIAEHKRLYK